MCVSVSFTYKQYRGHSSIIMDAIVISDAIQKRAAKLFKEVGFEQSNNFSNAETLFTALLDVMSSQQKTIKELNKKTEENLQEVTSRATVKDTKSTKCHLKAHEDQIDMNHQYSMKGNFIISTFNNIIDSKLEGEEYTEKLLEEIEGCYGVKISKNDISACHKLGREGSHIIRFVNRKPGSSYDKLSEAVKKGGKFGVDMKEYKDAEKAWTAKRTSRGPKPTKPTKPNLFCNFQLTSKRAAIAKQLRTLKFENKIANYYTDQNGKIAMRVTREGPKIFLTFDWNKLNSSTVDPSKIEELYLK